MKRLNLPERVKDTLEQGFATRESSPDACVGILRTSVQQAILSLTQGTRGEWSSRLDKLLEKGATSEWGARSARRVCEVGDIGLHGERGVNQIVVSDEIAHLAAFFLWSSGFDVSQFLAKTQADRIRRYLGFITRTRWKGPAEFNGDWNPSLFEGGLLDVLYACPSCGAEVLGEGLHVPHPNGSGENQEESYAYGHVPVVCLACGADGDLLSTNSFSGWCVDTDGIRKRYRRQNRRGVQPFVNLPPTEQYLYRVDRDYADRPEPEY